MPFLGGLGSALGGMLGLPQGGFDPRIPDQNARDGLLTRDSQVFRDQRAEDDRRRAGHLSQLDDFLRQSEAQADDIERMYREAGLANVASRYRQGARQNAFAQARRGLAGGSADADAQMGLQAGADDDARGALLQARQAGQGYLTGALGDFYGARQAAMSGNPYTMEGADLARRAIEDRMNARRRLYGLAEARQSSNEAYQQGLAGLSGGFLSGFAGGFGRTFGRAPEPEPFFMDPTSVGGFDFRSSDLPRRP